MNKFCKISEDSVSCYSLNQELNRSSYKMKKFVREQFSNITKN